MFGKKNWEFLKGKFEAGQLGHAYIFSGPDQLAKKQVVKDLVTLINGNNKAFDLAIEKEQFPDLLVVKSANSKSSLDNGKDMMEIDVAQIREVNNFLSLHSYYGNYKAVIVENADRMNVEAQNTFLKTLEEPKGKTLIVLVCDKPDALLQTISSRCQTLAFLPKGKQEFGNEKGLQDLMGIINSELAVKFQYTKKANLEGEQVGQILQTLQRHFRNLLLAELGIGKSTQLHNYSIEKLKHIIRSIEVLHRQLATTNANAKMALEILLLEL